MRFNELWASSWRPRSTARLTARLIYMNIWLFFGPEWIGYLTHTWLDLDSIVFRYTNQARYIRRPCKKSRLFRPSTINFELNIFLNSWSNWCLSGGFIDAAVVKIANSKNGDLRDSDWTVASEGTITKGKKGALFLKSDSSCSASWDVSFRCSIIFVPSSGQPFFSSESSSPKTCWWCSCISLISLIPSGAIVEGRSREKSEPSGLGDIVLLVAVLVVRLLEY